MRHAEEVVGRPQNHGSRDSSRQQLNVILQEGFPTLADTTNILGWVTLSCGHGPGHPWPLPTRMLPPNCKNQRCVQTSLPYSPWGQNHPYLGTRALQLGTIGHFAKAWQCVCVCSHARMHTHKCFSFRNNVFQSKTQELHVKSQGNFPLSLKHLERKNHYEF